MLRTILAKNLRDQRRLLLGWSIGIVALVLLMSMVWPSFRDMPDLDKFLANYPKEMRELFKIESMTTGTGYLNAELFSLMLPVLFIIFAISRGARAIAGDEENGTLDPVLVTPVSAARLALAHALTLATTLCGLGAVLFVATLLAGAAAGMHLATAGVASGVLAVILLGLEFGMLALAVGAATGRRGWAIGVASVAAVVAYVLYLLGGLVDAIRSWRPVSPFYQALDHGPLDASLPGTCLWLIGPALLLVLGALGVFQHRDIATR